MSYGSDFLTGGSATAESNAGAEYVAAKAFDDDDETRWASDDQEGEHWVKYDLGVGVTKTAAKLRLYPCYDYPSHIGKAFKLEGSNNDADWDGLTTGECTESNGWQDFTFSNSTAYRYYMVTITSYWAGHITSLWEVELMESTTLTIDVHDCGEIEEKMGG